MLFFTLTMRGIVLRLSQWLHEPKKVELFWRLTVTGIVCIGIIVPSGVTHAAFGMTDALNYLLTFFAYILQWIILMLGNLVIFLVDLVIKVSQYNSFVRSQPVQTGWPIVRDVINMFFIVVLLLSAFSTIIGYEKYHYSNIVKKFFLMAALVNFSLPLLGIAIDFSQVLMLTFVNGFKAAAAGNFVTILKLDQVMKIESNAIDLAADNGTNIIENPMVKKVIAMMFGIFVLGISATILAIMLVYLIARIVGLWVLLITSPGAFFVTGLPSSLQGKIPGFGGDWWNKFWSLLTGGPIMAFFLWLTLATASNIGPTFTQAQYAGTGETVAAQNYFQTAIGTVENFGTYLVAIIMLFTGLSTAVSQSNAVAPLAGKAASKIRDYGLGTTKFLAYGGAAAAGAYGARKLGTAGGELASAADRTYNLTKPIGSGIQALGVRLGSTGIATMGAKIAGTRGRAVKRKQEIFEEQTKGLSTPKRMDFAKKRMNSLLSNKDERKALSELLTKDAFSTEGQKHLLEQYQAEAEKMIPENDPMREKKIDAYKKMRLGSERSKMLEDYKSAVGENEEKLKWIREKIESAPSHAQNVKAYVTGEMDKDPAYFRKIKIEDFENAAVPLSVLAASGYTGNELTDKEGLVGKAMQGGGKKAQLLRAMDAKLKEAAADITRETGETITVQDLLKTENEDRLKQRGFFDAYFVKDTSDPINEHRLVLNKEVGAGTETPVPLATTAPRVTGTVIRNDERILEGQRAIERARAALELVRQRPAGPDREMEAEGLTQEIHSARQQMINAGASAAEVFETDAGGHFQTPEDRRQYEASVQTVFNEGKKDFKTYSKVDLSVVNQNPEGDNEARRSMVRNVDVGALGMSYLKANEANDKTSTTNIARIASAIDTEGNRHQKVIDRYNEEAEQEGKPKIDSKEIIASAKAFQSASSEAAQRAAEQSLKNAMMDSGVIMDMDDAIAIAKRQEVLSDPVLQHYNKHASKRSMAAMDRGQRKKEESRFIREAVSDAVGDIKGKVQRAGERTRDAKQVIRDVITQQPRAGRRVSETDIEDKRGLTTTRRQQWSEDMTRRINTSSSKPEVVEGDVTVKDEDWDA
jgi:hypothetical protein